MKMASLSAQTPTIFPTKQQKYSRLASSTESNSGDNDEQLKFPSASAESFKPSDENDGQYGCEPVAEDTSLETHDLESVGNTITIDDSKSSSSSSSSSSLSSLELPKFSSFGVKNDCDGFSKQFQYLPRRMRYLASIVLRNMTANFIDDAKLLILYRKICCSPNNSNEEDTRNDRRKMGYDHDDGGLILIKLMKLWIIVILGILIMNPLAKWMEWHTDEDYTLADFLYYDLPSVFTDMLFFFFVGRLYQPYNPGIDSLYFIFFLSLGAIYPSIANNFDFLRHALSIYAIMCRWPAILFVYVIALLITAGGLIVGLVRSHYRRGVLGSRLVESVVLFLVCFAPYIANDNFHLHHWYGMWWLGMQSNAPEWWIRCFMAYCLGSYINGIAVYGRDPILACEYAFYRSTNQECAFMACYVEESTEGNETEYKPFVAPDWRTCSED